MHRYTRAAGMTWNAYYRDKMNRVVGIRPIRIDDVNFATRTTYFRLTRATLDYFAVILNAKILHIYLFFSFFSNVKYKKLLKLFTNSYGYFTFVDKIK